MGILDIGSNTVHLLAADARPGGRPQATTSDRTVVRQELPGITPDRTFQIVAAAVCLRTAMKMLDLDELEVSPWALREGVMLRYTESMSWGGGGI